MELDARTILECVPVRLRLRSTGETRELKAGLVLGRLAACDWTVEDASVSRRHARVLREAEVWLVEDLGSSNGTFLNGVRGQRLALRPGDLVTFGSVAFDVLALEGAAADTAPTRAGPASATATAATPAASARVEAAAAAQAERERARLQGNLRRPQRSRGFGDLSQQSVGMKFLALLLGLAVLAGVTVGVRLVAGLF